MANQYPPIPDTAGAPPGAASAADADADAPVRVIELSQGQRVQATVVENHPEGGVTIGVFGGKVFATSKMPLELGQSYDFTVAATRPHVVLTAARPTQVPGIAAADSQARLGVPGSLLRDLVNLARSLAAPESAAEHAAAQRGAGGRAAGRSMQGGWLQAPAAGPVHAEALRAFGQGLGHDQEARVLRLEALPPAQRTAEARALQTTAKAEALRFLQQFVESPIADRKSEARAARARELVQGLGSIERDNARRADSGAPLWLPLPAAPEAGLRDARMFLLRGEGEADSGRRAGEGQPFRVVLLLDLTQLGALRVDVSLREHRVSVAIETVEDSAATTIRAALDALHTDMESDGLEVESLTVRRAPGQSLSVADLCAPPSTGSNQHLLDVHA